MRSSNELPKGNCETQQRTLRNAATNIAKRSNEHCETQQKNIAKRSNEHFKNIAKVTIKVNIRYYGKHITMENEVIHQSKNDMKEKPEWEN